jgi:acyl-coenzyme A synthetase/AMP-(fatty) acid ligase
VAYGMPRPTSIKDENRCPLFDDDALDQAIAWRGGRGIARRALLADAERLAASLPAGQPIANASIDRYNLLVAVVAGLSRGLNTLLPPDSSRSGLAALGQKYKNLVCLTDQPIDAIDIETRVVWFDGRASDRPGCIPAIQPSAPAVTLFTSGTTGEPIPTTRNWTWLTTTARHYQSGLNIGHLRNLNILATVPSQHAYGLEGAIMLPLCTDAAVHATMPLFPRDIAASLNEMADPRALLTTPFHLRVLLESRIRMPELAVIISAAAHLPTEVAAQAEARYGVPVMEIYGCTEVGLIASRRTVCDTVWTLPDDLRLQIDGVRARIVAPHLGGAVELTDAIEQLSEDTFRMHGRTSEIVKIAGKRASLSGLNSALTSIDGIDDGIFVLWPDDRHATNRRLIAFVVVPERDLDEIRRDLRTVIPAPFLPRRLIRVPTIPRNATGKVRRKDLVAMAQKASSSR